MNIGRKPWGWSKGKWDAYLANRRAIAAKNLYISARRSTYKPNGKTEEVIGLISGSFTHITTDAVPGTLTQTIFDTTSRADSAQILLTNSTGGSRVIIAAWIRGKAVTRLSGSEGYLHDKFVDYEMQAKDGDIVYETGNNFVVTADQVNQLADYYWKLNKTKKHIYTLSLVGFQTWYEPGEWYTLQIGGAGEAEYIDSTVECFDVRCSIAAGGAGYTSVSFREVEESWKFDSNEVARMIASGGFNRRPSQSVVTVAAQYYSGYADYYCDGTDDQEEINSAAAYANGVVQLTKGDYDISSSITLTDDRMLRGEGAATVLKVSEGSIKAITAIGTSSTLIQNVTVDNLAVQYATSLGSLYSSVYLQFVENYCISNVVVKTPNSIYVEDCRNGFIINNVISQENASLIAGGGGGETVLGIVVDINTITSYSNIVQSNVVRGLKALEGLVGIFVDDDIGFQSCLVSNNKVSDLYIATSGICLGIANWGGNGNVISSNMVYNCKVGTTSGSVISGIWIATGSTSVSANNNYSYNNFDDTGIANTNHHNFFDGGTNTQWAG